MVIFNSYVSLPEGKWIDQDVSRTFGLFTNMFPFILPLKWIDLLSCSIDGFSLDFPWIFPGFSRLFSIEMTISCHARHHVLGLGLWSLRLQEPATIAGTIVGSFLSKSALGDLLRIPGIRL